MKTIAQCTFFVAALCLSLAPQAQTIPDLIWQKSYGGSNLDVAYSFDQTADSGFIIVGASTSDDGSVSDNQGLSDYWIVKLNANGDFVWQKNLGGSAYDYAESVSQLTNGGFIIAGYSFSDDGDVNGNKGGSDYWIVKLSEGGDLIWKKIMGGTADDEAYSIRETADSGFIVAGYSYSNDGDVTGNHGLSDFWIVKLEADGTIDWQKSLGGTGEDQAACVQEISTGGFIVAGWSGSIDSGDYRILKLDNEGNTIWEKSYGGTADDKATAIRETSDGGFIVAGHSYSNDGDVTGNWGDADYWVLKLDSDGNLTWQKSLGGTLEDYANDIQQTTDGGYIVAGKSESVDGLITLSQGNNDFWIAKLDSTGNFLTWQKSLGGSKDDVAFSIQQTIDGGYVIAGWTASTNGDVTFNNGIRDFWIVKLSGDFESGIAPLSNTLIDVYPNPVIDVLIISLPACINETSIQVYDLSGKQFDLPFISSQTSAGQNSIIHLSTSALPDGFYTLQIADEKTGVYKTSEFLKVH